MIDTGYNMAEDRGYIKGYKYGEFYVWIVAVLTQQYCMAAEYDLLNKGQFKFMAKWAQINGRPMKMIDAWN